MKADIHPKYYPEAKVICACGNTWITGATQEIVRTDICSKCHPFFTGEQRIVDTAGQVERFTRRVEKGREISEELATKAAARKPARVIEVILDEGDEEAGAESVMVTATESAVPEKPRARKAKAVKKDDTAKAAAAEEPKKPKARKAKPAKKDDAVEATAAEEPKKPKARKVKAAKKDDAAETAAVEEPKKPKARKAKAAKKDDAAEAAAAEEPKKSKARKAKAAKKDDAAETAAVEEPKKPKARKAKAAKKDDAAEAAPAEEKSEASTTGPEE